VADRPALLLLAVLVTGAVACGGTSSGGGGSVRSSEDSAVTIASFDFAESALLAEIYAQTLEGAGYRVNRKLRLGPRELVSPALSVGLVDFVPEYLGTALQFLDLDAGVPDSDVQRTRDRLMSTVEGSEITMLASAPAQDSNTFVMRRQTAELFGVRTLSDLALVAPGLTFGGPPECPTRPFCLAGLQRRYGVQFSAFITLDAGGPLTRQALANGQVDVGLMFTTDPSTTDPWLVVLQDDRSLQPAENVTPLVRRDLIRRLGQSFVDIVDGVSQQITTVGLRDLNTEVAAGEPTTVVAAAWLSAQLTAEGAPR
jgi:osmoprotectant transport system substrate-binding protein